MSRHALGWLFVMSLAAGLLLMLALDRPLTRILGVASMFTFVVAGLFLIADESS